MNIDELDFICEGLKLKFRDRHYKIQVSDALMIFMFTNSSLKQKEGCNDLELNYLSYLRLNKIVRDSLFGPNIGISAGLGLWLYDYNFLIGGSGDDCCCIQGYNYYSQPTDSIFQSGLPISKFVFDYICSELSYRIKNSFINLSFAKTLVRTVNTIILNSSKDPYYNHLLSWALSEEVQFELGKVYFFFKSDIDKNNLGDFKMNNFCCTSNYYNIINFPEPGINYNFK